MRKSRAAHIQPPRSLSCTAAQERGDTGCSPQCKGWWVWPGVRCIYLLKTVPEGSALSLAALPAQHTNPKLGSPDCLLLPRQSHHPRPAQREHKGKPRGEGEVPSSCQSSFCARGQILFTGSCSRAEPWERSSLGGENSHVSLTLPFPIPPWCPRTSPIAGRRGAFTLHYKQ